MTDLISREAAIAAALATMAEAKSFGIPQMAMGASKVADDLRALPAQAPAVKVKPLVWQGDERHFTASGFNTVYKIAVSPNLSLVRWQQGYMGTWLDAVSVDAAKAAAQADYEARILAALDLAEGAEP